MSVNKGAGLLSACEGKQTPYKSCDLLEKVRVFAADFFFLQLVRMQIRAKVFNEMRALLRALLPDGSGLSMRLVKWASCPNAG